MIKKHIEINTIRNPGAIFFQVNPSAYNIGIIIHYITL